MTVATPIVRVDATNRVVTTLLITAHLFIAFLQSSQWQLGDLGVLRGVILGFSKKARTRGFAALALASCAIVNEPKVRPNRMHVQLNANDFDYYSTIKRLRSKTGYLAKHAFGILRSLPGVWRDRRTSALGQ